MLDFPQGFLCGPVTRCILYSDPRLIQKTSDMRGPGTAHAPDEAGCDSPDNLPGNDDGRQKRSKDICRSACRRLRNEADRKRRADRKADDDAAAAGTSKVLDIIAHIHDESGFAQQLRRRNPENASLNNDELFQKIEQDIETYCVVTNADTSRSVSASTEYRSQWSFCRSSRMIFFCAGNIGSRRPQAAQPAMGVLWLIAAVYACTKCRLSALVITQ